MVSLQGSTPGFILHSLHALGRITTDKLHLGEQGLVRTFIENP